MAKLYFRHSAMASGKTAHLLAVAGNYHYLGKKVLLLKPKIDSRSGEYLVESRLNIQRHADYLLEADTVIPVEWLVDVHCILVDEGQFLSYSVVKQLRDITVRNNIPVIVYGLRTDYQLQLFDGSKALFELADSIEELNKTICNYCFKKKAIVNHRRDQTNQEKIVIGGSEIYASICYSCYLNSV